MYDFSVRRSLQTGMMDGQASRCRALETNDLDRNPVAAWVVVSKAPCARLFGSSRYPFPAVGGLVLARKIT